MNAGPTLFPMMVLALLAGCSPAPDGQASAREGTGRPAALPASSTTQDAPTPHEAAGPASVPAILPDIDPALAVTQAARGGEPKAVRRTPVDPASTPPMEPSAVDMPPPAYVPDLPPSDGAADAQPFPDEVTRYMVDRDSCDHFRGEEAYDAERLAYLQENIAALCTGTDARLALLRQLYARDPAVMAALSGYDDRIEGNASQ
ncbi:hypothetical protein NUH86_00775 [Sphingobium sp. JS3065]|uniref:hypothetical protein n=1 Tax=Sphingobium sp. JS3065 TaxID=2970925 RepID=UPI002264E3DC|nr:hypothetical protein [Sphingobium sp. JS3065]UZW55372.1 hypothetical protein NUH86_00775 [Sphingobium sp. JS3065]